MSMVVSLKRLDAKTNRLAVKTASRKLTLTLILAERELREPLQMARKELGCEKKTSCLMQLQ
jgi:hypothetical protein